MENIEEILKKMTLEDKISFCTGADFWHTKKMEQYGIPSIMMSDGPHGLRCQKDASDMIGINQSIPATCFPTAVTSGATWNRDLLGEEGKAIAEEAVAAEVDVVLGPGCNIKRNPLCGRNFEYFSEDPVVAGELAAAFINGQQSTGVGSSLKHFAVNNQEYKRQNGDSLVDDRALREIYLKPFEIAVKKSQPQTVMCSYNKINGLHASDNEWLLNTVLRKEWGFEGLVVTDWGAMSDRVLAYKAGCDLNMPGGSRYMEKAVMKAVKNGSLSENDVNQSVRRILKLIEKAENRKEKQPVNSVSQEAHNALACKIAEQGAVLLKNQDSILPLKEDFVIIGSMAKDFRYQGAGSSHINPTSFVSLVDSLPQMKYCPCGDKNGIVKEEELQAAVEAAKAGKTVVIVTGLPESYESEGFDRSNMKMPQDYNNLIEKVAEVNPNTVVVLLGGSPMELPWADKVKGILFMGLSGQMGGRACGNLLTGKAVPGGKLTESWPFVYEDVASTETFGKKNTEYRESIYVGYRYYDKANVKVRYAFGYGLSYTEFAYSDLKIDGRKVSVTIKNTGNVQGSEVVQLYAAPPEGVQFVPEKELKDFARVELVPGESKTVDFELDDRCLSYWVDGWKTVKGQYKILIGASSEDIRAEGILPVENGIDPASLSGPEWYKKPAGKPSRETWEKLMGHPVPVAEELQKGQYTMDSTCLEMKDSSIAMRIMYKVMEKMLSKGFGGKPDYSDPTFKMMMVCMTDCPMRSMVISAGGMMQDNIAEGLLAMANGHLFKGLKKMILHNTTV